MAVCWIIINLNCWIKWLNKQIEQSSNDKVDIETINGATQ